MIETVKEETLTVIKGTGHFIEKVLDAIAEILTTAVKDIAKVGIVVGTAATRLVTKVIKDTKEVVVKTEHATGVVVGGAFKITGEVATAVVHIFRHPALEPGDSKKVESKGPELAVTVN